MGWELGSRSSCGIYSRVPSALREPENARLPQSFSSVLALVLNLLLAAGVLGKPMATGPGSKPA